MTADEDRRRDLNLLLAALDDERAKPTELADRLGWALERVHQAHGDALEQGLVEQHAPTNTLQLTNAGADRLHPKAAQPSGLQAALDGALERLQAAAAGTSSGDGLGQSASAIARDWAIAYSVLEVAQDRVDERAQENAGRVTVDREELERWFGELGAARGVLAHQGVDEARRILDDLQADIATHLEASS